MSGAGESSMPQVDEGLVHAWLDGALDTVETARVAALVASEHEWAAAAADARGLIAASSRIVRALDQVPGGVVPRRGGASSRRAPRWWMARAAALLLVVAGTAIVWRERGTPIVAKETAPPPSVVSVIPPSAAATSPARGMAKASVTVKASPGTTGVVRELATIGSVAESTARSPARLEDGRSLDAAKSAEKRRAGTPARSLLSKQTGVAGGAVAAKDAGGARPLAADRVETMTPVLRKSAPSAERSCFVVRSPPAFAGRTVVQPADSGSKALWDAVGINPDSLLVRQDSLLGPAPKGSRGAAVRVVAVRSRCPGR